MDISNPITEPSACASLAEDVAGRATSTPARPVLTPVAHAREIIAHVAEERCVPVALILGKCRIRRVVTARYIAIHRVNKAFPAWSYPRLAARFNLDHTTVLYALGKLHHRQPTMLAVVRAAA